MKENRHARNVLKKILNRTEQKNENPRYIRQLSVWCAYERSLNERFYFGIPLVFASALSRKQKQNENSFDQRALMWTRSCFDGIDSKTFSIYFPYAINLRFFFLTFGCILFDLIRMPEPSSIAQRTTVVQWKSKIAHTEVHRIAHGTSAGVSRFGICSIATERNPLFEILLYFLMAVCAGVDRIPHEPFFRSSRHFSALEGVVGPQNVSVREIFYFDRFTTFHSMCFRCRCTECHLLSFSPYLRIQKAEYWRKSN